MENETGCIFLVNRAKRQPTGCLLCKNGDNSAMFAIVLIPPKVSSHRGTPSAEILIQPGILPHLLL